MKNGIIPDDTGCGHVSNFMIHLQHDMFCSFQNFEIVTNNLSKPFQGVNLLPIHIQLIYYNTVF